MISYSETLGPLLLKTTETNSQIIKSVYHMPVFWRVGHRPPAGVAAVPRSPASWRWQIPHPSWADKPPAPDTSQGTLKTTFIEFQHILPIRYIHIRTYVKWIPVSIKSVSKLKQDNYMCNNVKSHLDHKHVPHETCRYALSKIKSQL